MTVPYTFANQSGNIPLAELDTNFANVKAAADTAGVVTANSQPNITNIGVLTGLSVSGNINTQGNVVANNFVGTFAGNISNAVYATTAGTANTANTVSVAAQPNITSVGTLLSLAVAGNITSGNLLTAGQSSAAGNVTGANVLTIGDISATGNVTGGNISTAGNVSVAGNVIANNFIGNISGNISNAVYATTAGSSNTANTANTANTVTSGTQTNITSVGALFGLSVLGQISAAGAIFGGNGVISGNLNANLMSATLYTGGFISVAGNITGNKLLSLDNISAVGNVTGNYFIGNGSQLTGITAASSYGNANVATFLAAYGSNTITTTGNVVSGNTFITGLLSSTGNIAGANIIGYSIYANGVISASGNVDAQQFHGSVFGNNVVSNLTITSNDHFQFNVGNIANTAYIADGGMYITGFVSASGNVTGADINASNDITGGNIYTLGKVSAAGAIFGGNAVIDDNLNANRMSANLYTGGFISMGGNITGNKLLSLTSISSVGSITGGNILTAGITKTGVFTTGTLPSAATVGAGARALVTDANSNTFANLYVGSSGNTIPVWSNGSNWYIG